VLVVARYVEAQPNATRNPLAKYLPALQAIDSRGGGSSVTGLSGFIEASVEPCPSARLETAAS
jgi:hypothetical protein